MQDDSTLFSCDEVWRDVVGYEGLYQVSNYGRVKGVDRFVNTKGNTLKKLKGKFKATSISSNGYCVVSLWKNNKQETLCVHQLVAQAFLPNPLNLPEVNHKDENKRNNRLDNLEWCSCKYNSNWGTSKQRISEKLSKEVSQYSIEGVFIKEWDSQSEIERLTGYKQQSISRCCTGQRKTAYGYIWRYKEKEGD